MCAHTHTYTITYTHTYTITHTHTHTHIYIYIYTYRHIYLYTYTYMCCNFIPFRVFFLMVFRHPSRVVHKAPSGGLARWDQDHQQHVGRWHRPCHPPPRGRFAAGIPIPRSSERWAMVNQRWIMLYCELPHGHTCIAEAWGFRITWFMSNHGKVHHSYINIHKS